MKPKVVIIILNWNGKNNTINCLESLKSIEYSNYDIIIIDNGSSDNSVDYFRKEYPKIKIISNNHNLGYAKANNIGISYAMNEGTDYVLLLNNDTIVDPYFLTELVQVAESDAKIVIVQSKILLFEGDAHEHTYFDKYGATIKNVENTDVASIKDSLGFYPCGACMLIKKTVLNENFFDEKLFAYYEDVDTGWQFRLKNYKMRYAQKSICYHKGNSSLKNNVPFNLYLLWKNRTRIMIKNYSSYNLLKRLPVALMFEFSAALLYTFKTKKLNFICLYLKSIYWNILNLKDTLNQRKIIQSNRVISDDQIEDHMINHSIDMLLISKHIQNCYR